MSAPLDATTYAALYRATFTPFTSDQQAAWAAAEDVRIERMLVRAAAITTAAERLVALAD